MEINHSAPSKATKSITISATPEKIWGFIVDVNKWPSWNPDVKKAHLNDVFEVGNSFKWESGVSIVSTVREVVPYTK
jgi:uncharacterized protein YndB with AHSA1/START domain